MKRALIIFMLILPANAFAAEPIIRLPLDGERIGAQITDLCPSEKNPAAELTRKDGCPMI